MRTSSHSTASATAFFTVSASSSLILSFSLSSTLDLIEYTYVSSLFLASILPFTFLSCGSRKCGGRWSVTVAPLFGTFGSMTNDELASWHSKHCMAVRGIRI